MGDLILIYESDDGDGADPVHVDAAALLAALYNRAKPAGLGAFQDFARRGQLMTRAEALKLIEEGRPGYFGHGFEFDYVFGRPLKVRAERDRKLYGARLYDRDQGQGAFKAALAEALAYRP